MFGERTVVGDFELFFGEPWAFEEYDSTLYIVTARWGSMRPDWATAIHALAEQDGNRAVVETTVTAYDHRGSGNEMPMATFNFTFIDGRIESGLGQWEWPEIEVQAEVIADFSAAKASISGTWEIEYGNSRITISEDGRFEINRDNMTVISGQYTIARAGETDYRLTLLPDRVRNISVNQPEFGSPRFDDEERNFSPNWMQQEIIINPLIRNILGFVGHDGMVEWANVSFDPEVLWLEDRI